MEVTIEDGIVTLSGVVIDFYKKGLANTVSRRVIGVKAVAEDIVVKYGDTLRKTDKEIAKAGVNTLKWNVSVPKEKGMVLIGTRYIFLSGNIARDY
jgi:hypothetical protein